ncbi:MAG: hexitol phosphatase HxpB [Chitinophagales bacterium]|nr:hexitol phosphatase HxpB [Chitinophagales bacterium]
MLNGNKILAVIYDMDGVIIDSEPLWKEAEIKVFKNIGLELSEEDCEMTRGFRTDEVIQFWYSRKPWKGKSVEVVTREIIEEMKLLIAHKGKSINGLLNSLEFCRSMGYKIGLCTSSHPELIDAVLNKFEIRDYFSIIKSAFEVTYGKPHPEVYILTAKELDIDTQHCLVVEDSLYGMISAKAAKMNVVVMPEKTQSSWPQWSIADFQIEDLNDLQELEI